MSRLALPAAVHTMFVRHAASGLGRVQAYCDVGSWSQCGVCYQFCHCGLCHCVQVNKVAGNFHFAAGHSYQQGSMHIHDMAPFTDKTLDFSHKIHSLSFGQSYPVSDQSVGVLALMPAESASIVARSPEFGACNACMQM